MDEDLDLIDVFFGSCLEQGMSEGEWNEHCERFGLDPIKDSVYSKLPYFEM